MSEPVQRIRPDPNGFVWEVEGGKPLEVHATAGIDRGRGQYARVVTLACGNQHIDVYITRSGRSIRAFLHDPKMGAAEMQPGEWRS